MENKDWNPEEWQGKSKRQVEDTYKIMEIFFKACGFLFIGWVTYVVFENILG